MKSAKARILYIETEGKVRANDGSTTVISVAGAISKPRTNRNLARFPGPIRQYVRHLAQRNRVHGGDAEASRCVPLGVVSHLKNSLSIASRGTRRLGALPKNCHLLPSTAIF
jgi:hypothetical protein